MLSSKRRVFPVTTYLTEDEYRDLQRVADRAGLAVSDTVRMCVKYVMNEVLVHTTFMQVVKAVSRGEAKEGDEDAPLKFR